MRLSSIIFIFFVFISCNTKNKELIDELTESQVEQWFVDKKDIEGGPGLFEVMNTPSFVDVSEIKNLTDTDKVALISFENEIRIYPYYYTNYYEVVNDVFRGSKIAITYCPITKSGICFNRTIDNIDYDIIASGYLYKSNMVPSDKDQSFYWSQMLMNTIGGNHQNQKINYYNLIETNWKTVKEHFKNGKVFFHNNTSKIKSDQKSAYEGSEYLYGILNSKFQPEIELFSYANFGTESTKIKYRYYNNRNTIIIGNSKKRFITSFYTKENLKFHLLNESNFPNILKDNEGNIWNIFGYAVLGVRKGEQLESPRGYIAQYWAWNDFYENLNLN